MDETITLGPFEVGPCIGQGGMGKIFEVVHRDLKPENLLLFDADVDGVPRGKIADFGLAHALDEVTARHEPDEVRVIDERLTGLDLSPSSTSR